VKSGASSSPVCVRSGAVSGVEELTDIGGSSSRGLEGEEGTDIGVAAAADWLKRAESWDSVMQIEPRQSLSLVPVCSQVISRARADAWNLLRRAKSAGSPSSE
jgi:hypothetical protein